MVKMVGSYTRPEELLIKLAKRKHRFEETG